MTSRRLSWKSAHRKNRPSSDPKPTASTTYHIQQELNPYKPSSSLRGSQQQQHNNNASIQEGNYERNASRQRRLSDSLHDCAASVGEEEDLDLILSGIELDDGSKKSPQRVSLKDVALPAVDIEVKDLQMTNRDRDRPTNPNGRVHAIRNVDFGNNSAIVGEDARIKERLGVGLSSSRESSTMDTSYEQDILQSRVGADEDQSSDALLGKHTSSTSTTKHQQQQDMTISFTEEPLEQSTKCFVDEIMQDSPIMSSSILSEDAFKSKPIHEVVTCPSSILQCKEPPETSFHNRQNDNNKLDPIESIRHDKSTDFRNNTSIDSHKNKKASNIFGVIHHHHNQADDTISTVTDQTDSPYIFTYKRSNNDGDSVSQITSSVAPSLVSLKNIPESSRGEGLLKSTGAITNRFQSSSWISRTTKRGVVTPGTFGRDKNRKNAGAILSSGRSIGSNGTTESPYQESNSNLDEIAYAINGLGRQHPQKRPSLPRNRVQEFDLCTIDSEKSGVSRRRSAQDSQSYTSTLGNGAASCAGYSLTNGSASKASSSRSGGLLHGFALLARRAERFFLPTSPKVTQRKKFDRSDSLEDLLLEEGANSLKYQRSSDETKDDEIDYFSRAMLTSSYGSRSRGSSHGNNNTRKMTSSKGFRLCLVVILILTIYLMISSDGDNSNEGNSRPDKERGFRLRNIAKHRDGRPEFGPVNNPRLQSESVPDKVHHNHYSDPASRESPPSYESDRLKKELHMPLALQNLANVDSGPFQRGIEIPFYWHVPRSGGGTISDVLGSCLNLAIASDAGGSAEFAHEETLRVVQFSRLLSFLNVDTYTPNGIQRAKQLNLVTSGLVDAIISPLLHDAASLFTPTRKGRMITMLRHPIERAASLFYFIQDTQWKQPETRNEKLADISIERFYEQGLAENNWMTRFLTNQITKSELTNDDLNVAKQILKDKFLVGLMEKKLQSIDRFQKYFGWIASDENCIRNKVEWSWPMKHRHDSVEEGSEAWDLISAQNTFDIMLYDYAKELFVQQESSIPYS